jgi:hypothetical protein
MKIKLNFENIFIYYLLLLLFFFEKVFMFGIFMWEVLSGQIPFSDLNYSLDEIRSKIIKNELRPSRLPFIDSKNKIHKLNFEF